MGGDLDTIVSQIDYLHGLDIYLYKNLQVRCSKRRTKIKRTLQIPQQKCLPLLFSITSTLDLFHAYPRSLRLYRHFRKRPKCFVIQMRHDLDSHDDGAYWLHPG